MKGVFDLLIRQDLTNFRNFLLYVYDQFLEDLGHPGESVAINGMPQFSRVPVGCRLMIETRLVKEIRLMKHSSFLILGRQIPMLEDVEK